MSFEDLRRSLKASRPHLVPRRLDVYPDPYETRKLDPHEGERVPPLLRLRPKIVTAPAKQANEGGTPTELVFFTAEGTHTPVCVLHGPGGTGKTFRIRQYQEQHEEQTILMTATTGVAAINIGPGCVTVNSAFKYFNEESLTDQIKYRSEIIAKEIRTYDMVVIDEMSMLSHTALDLLYGFIESLNRQQKSKIKLVLSGDFCQLPPMAPKEEGKRNAAIPFAFRSPLWPPVFEPAITKLTQNFRQQGDEHFMRALHHARTGNAAACVAMLQCDYSSTVDMDFKGLTLYSTNKDVDEHNQRKLKAINSPLITDQAHTWGEPSRDWKDLAAPFSVKLGAQVRITANDTPSFAYVNGDIGTLRGVQPRTLCNHHPAPQQ